MKRFLILLLMLMVVQGTHAQEYTKIYEQPRLFLEVEPSDHKFIVIYKGQKTGEKVRTVATVPDCIRDDGTCRVKITLPTNIRQIYTVKVKVKDVNGELVRKYNLPAVKTVKPRIRQLKGPEDGTVIELGGLFRISYSIYGPRLEGATERAQAAGLHVEVTSPSGAVFKDDFFCTGYNCYFDYQPTQAGTYTWRFVDHGLFGTRTYENHTFIVH